MFEDDFLGWKVERIDKSRPPLRWIANLAGEISGWAIWNAAMLDEDEDFGFRYKVYSKIFAISNPLYSKYGTFYKVKTEIEE